MTFECMDVNRCLVRSTSNLSRHQYIKRRQKKGSTKRHGPATIGKRENSICMVFFPVPIDFGHPNMAQCVMQTDGQIQFADMQSHSYRSGGCKELTVNTDEDRV